MGLVEIPVKRKTEKFYFTDGHSDAADYRSRLDVGDRRFHEDPIAAIDAFLSAAVATEKALREKLDALIDAVADVKALREQHAARGVSA